MSLPDRLILFDGVCNFCDNTVQWIIREDKKNTFFFSSLQSKTGQEILTKYQLNTQDIDSVVYLRNQKIYIKSTAVLYILKDLGGIKSVMFLFIVLPASLRDFFYDQFAKRRYALFGKKDECMLPSKEIRSKFIDN